MLVFYLPLATALYARAFLLTIQSTFDIYQCHFSLSSIHADPTYVNIDSLFNV